MANSKDVPPLQCKLSHGFVMVGAPPNEDLLTRLKASRISHVMTLQTADENADTVRHCVRAAGLRSHWFPIANTVNCSETELQHFRGYIRELSDLLNEGASVYLHDGNSQTRSALLFYALLHLRGIPSASAWSILNDVTQGTAKTIRKPELHWAASLGAALR